MLSKLNYAVWVSDSPVVKALQSRSLFPRVVSILQDLHGLGRHDPFPSQA